MLLSLLGVYSYNHSSFYYTEIEYILSNNVSDAKTYIDADSNVHITCNYKGQNIKLDSSDTKKVKIDANYLCVVNLTVNNQKIEINGPAQVYVNGDNNVISNKFDLSRPLSHPLVIINGHKNTFNIKWSETSDSSYTVISAFVNDADFKHTDPGDTNFDLATSKDSGLVGDIGPFYSVNISQIYPSSDYVIYYHGIPIGGTTHTTDPVTIAIIVSVVVTIVILAIIATVIVIICCVCKKRDKDGFQGIKADQ
ncbi:hypothetical protein TVAG_461170 [Trichomonas vaginalis G3]|uniref:Uncharacterized protein n=1 Tax=Trichomonas vaginalis (strain ATCC PRA-98 / G3) TaxID=412133 RepID=A2G9Y7_TRIV3|nr:hypothetical protein TVAGG3_0196810 [Trichomonas vaginalis G3]EAX86033.1 hypothetical protein TVAG_461170 [Trichomonas vaginalis G3]KAI5550357.1 hypothetical protein TVAGG3_0196810 [Trichomonas vaginalis G3]|eukprot:XP_001298963.1 hypothetical protein [Trichomonas vaginalis G3]